MWWWACGPGRRQWVLGMLAEVMSNSCPAPAAIAVTSLANDPYSGGAYTHVPPNVHPPPMRGSVDD
jgi:hypothetical protein